MSKKNYIPQEPTIEAALLVELLAISSSVLVKKLSNNDRDWARFTNKHQAGVYIPPLQRDGGFFPPLSEKNRGSDGGDPIREVFFQTNWPEVNETRADTRLVHYTSKGPETHLTRLPKAAFVDLSPASFLVMGRVQDQNGLSYRCLTIDSSSEDALYLTNFLAIQPDFRIEIFDPALKRREENRKILDFAEQVIAAWKAGLIEKFARDSAAMPTTLALATLARNAYLQKQGIANLDSRLLDNPGDVLREVSRGIEWDMFREYQRRECAVALVRIVLGDQPSSVSTGQLIRSLVDKLPEIDALLLSASQQRKSRAGYSFEHHIEAMLVGGQIPFEKQVVIQSKKRPDFILPSLSRLQKPSTGQAAGLILSAKTTLRERWKQVEREMHGSELFLATVDENIASNAIEEMAGMGINLVVPELLKKSKISEYQHHTNVIDFKTFFEIDVRSRMRIWGL
ncbi:EcoRII C terminal [Bosea sp. CRIB-10]|uniref:type II restriction endonuclease n=1 Tax=Bosea sp. CRIB-10 TaxID=378404 RepID=UPI0008E80CBC|nr:type II restriction endonuclease [Bosea sp. CRIB-10]SFB99017.1 EcoRII C terminal [Bosea sp. CRIB-10]